MNKMLVEQDELNLQDKELLLDFLKKDITLNLSGQNYLKIENLANQTNLTLNLSTKSSITIDLALSLANHEIKILINSGEESCLNFNFSATFIGTNNLTISNEVNVNNSKTNIRIRGVDNGGSLNILAMGKIFKETKNNKYLEDIKIITHDNNCVKIMPDLIVDSNSVEANHNATIAPVDKDSLFYLMSKGLTKEKSTYLIKQGFLKSILKNR